MHLHTEHAVCSGERGLNVFAYRAWYTEHAVCSGERGLNAFAYRAWYTEHAICSGERGLIHSQIEYGIPSKSSHDYWSIL